MPRRQPAAALDPAQVAGPGAARPEGRPQDVGRRHGVLNRQADPDAADRGHRVGRVPDAEQARPPPPAETVDPHAQQPHVAPVPQLAETIGELRSQRGQVGAERLQAGGPDGVVGTPGDEMAELPELVPVDADQATRWTTAQERRSLARAAAETEPQHVQVRLPRDGLQPGGAAKRRGSPVSGHRQARAHLQRSLRRRGAHAHDLSGSLDQPRRLCAHQEAEGRVSPGLVGQEAQEVPLGHVRDRPEAAGQPAEVHDRGRSGLQVRGVVGQLLVRQPEELADQAQFADDLERGRMDGVAAEVPRWVDATRRRPEVRAARIAEMVELLAAGHKHRPA